MDLKSKNSRPLVNRSKWATRAWTYQERLFSRRRLTFTNEQVIFECNTSDYFCESLNVDPHRYANGDRINSFNLFSDDRGDKYMDHITAYSKRELTHDSDVLNGLQGVSNISIARLDSAPIGVSQAVFRAICTGIVVGARLDCFAST
ncbi:hypothetical protein M3J09_000597 [Ascochyta lentis]